jgi:hypothetical protein
VLHAYLKLLDLELKIKEEYKIFVANVDTYVTFSMARDTLVHRGLSKR